VQLRGVEMRGPDSLLHSAQCQHTCFNHPQNYRLLRTAPRSACLTQTARSTKAWGCNSRQRCRVGKAMYALTAGCLSLCKPFTGHSRVQAQSRLRQTCGHQISTCIYLMCTQLLPQLLCPLVVATKITSLGPLHQTCPHCS